MTLQDLSKHLNKYDIAYSYNSSSVLESLKGLPFYNFQYSSFTKTFNHAIGLPSKEGMPCPLHDYEQMLSDTLQQYKHIWIKKATRLGITEFILRYMAWLCSYSPRFRGTQMCIVTGPRIELAITLIDRMKGLFCNFSNCRFDTKQTHHCFAHCCREWRGCFGKGSNQSR
jgi:hypothetical protein